VQGNVFIDCNAGVSGSSNVHCHPEVVRTIQEQAEQLIHICGTDYYYQSMPDLARKLDEIVPIDGPTRTHFGNSGTEAVETALKVAMHALARKFISFFGVFTDALWDPFAHGSRVAQRRGFKRQLLDVVHVLPERLAIRSVPMSAAMRGTNLGRWVDRERLFQSTTAQSRRDHHRTVQGEGGMFSRGFL
jgi:4-aminobutyrate aminotransferase